MLTVGIAESFLGEFSHNYAGMMALALLELVRGGRVTLGPEGELKMRRGRIDRTKEEQ